MVWTCLFVIDNCNTASIQPDKTLFLQKSEIMYHTAGWIGGPEVIFIVIVVLLLFGGKKIPELARGIGKGIREFRQATDDSGLANDIKDIKNEFDGVKKDVSNLDPTKAIKDVNPLKTKKK